MTTFHAFLGCSLDGYIAGASGELDWLTVFENENSGYEAFFESVDAMVMGRASYNAIRATMPDLYRGIPIYVLSSTLEPGAQPNMGASVVTVHPDIPTLRAALANAGVRRAYADGGRTVQSLLAASLLSDLTVTRVPVLIGSGIPLFGPLSNSVRAELVSSTEIGQGAVQSVYRFPVTV